MSSGRSSNEEVVSFRIGRFLHMFFLSCRFGTVIDGFSCDMSFVFLLCELFEKHVGHASI